MSENIHKGHRDRVKKEFLRHGFDQDTPHHKVLEQLLFYTVQQKDTNPIAHELIEKFGSLGGVLDAPVEELVKVNNITENSAVLFKMILPIARLYLNEKRGTVPEFLSLNRIGDFLVEKYLGFTEESLSLVGLNTGGKMLDFKFISKGDISAVGVSTRDVVKFALDCSATAVVMAHNHPGGIAVPSFADIEITKSVAEALKHINIRLLDHIIIANGDFVSLVQSEKYKHIF